MMAWMQMEFRFLSDKDEVLALFLPSPTKLKQE